jgi:hypothetical protein
MRVGLSVSATRGWSQTTLRKNGEEWDRMSRAEYAVIIKSRFVEVLGGV